MIAVARQTYRAWRELIGSSRFGRPANAGARPQVGALASQVQNDGADAFARSWGDLLDGTVETSNQRVGAR
jgi:hypothetical protein